MLSSAEFIKQSQEIHLFFGRIMKENAFFLEAGFTPKDAGFTNQADAFRMAFDGLLAETVSLSNGVREEVNAQREAYEQELFWNRIMAEHSKFIRGLLDPTEDELIKTANNFGNEFDQLTVEAKQAIDKTLPISKVTDDSLKATKKIREFNTQGTKGLLECKIKSIIIPLLGDHVLRESNHYLRLLKIFET